VEGITDVWRLGRGSVATFGVIYTHAQIMMIKKAGIKRAFILYDPEQEAQAQAAKLAYTIASFVPEVEVLNGFNCDPGDMSQEDVKSLRNMVFGKIY
jgi:hypothetical protein